MKYRIVVSCLMLVCMLLPSNKCYGDSVKNELPLVQNVFEYTYEDYVFDMRNEAIKKMNDVYKIEDRKEFYLSYMAVVNEYMLYIDPPETIYDYFTDDEIYLMQKAVETETFEADFSSKCNVASVILNRIRNEEFSNDVYELIIPGQFAFGRNNISDDTKYALEYVFMFGDTTNGALYFHSNNETPRFNGADWLFTDNVGHKFYK